MGKKVKGGATSHAASLLRKGTMDGQIHVANSLFVAVQAGF